MSNKNKHNNSVLHNLLLELLGADIEFIVFGVNPDYTTIIFNDINVRTFDFSKDGLYTFYIKFQ